MHPAKSVILFTTASGTGYGLVIVLAVLTLFGLMPTAGPLAPTALAIALSLIVIGLSASTFHLGHPERAWRALSQWRSSWLSREGVAAIVTFAPIGLYFLSSLVPERAGLLHFAFAGLAGACALATIYCTAMIYASLKTVPAWHNSWTVSAYLVFGPMVGAYLGYALAWLFGSPVTPALATCAIVLSVAGLAVKLAYWRAIDRDPGPSTAGSATGLGRFGTVRLLDAPHTQANYLMREMGFEIARKHRDKLRRIALALGFALPPVAVLATAWPGGAIAAIGALIALSSAAVAMFCERWLFFAEAKHVVTLYYGAADLRPT